MDEIADHLLNVLLGILVAWGVRVLLRAGNIILRRVAHRLERVTLLAKKKSPLLLSASAVTQ